MTNHCLKNTNECGEMSSPHLVIDTVIYEMAGDEVIHAEIECRSTKNNGDIGNKARAVRVITKLSF